MTRATSKTKILPSPILPVCAVRMMVSTGIDDIVGHHNFNFYFRQKIDHILGTTVQFGVPFLAAKAFTSVTVIPVMPTSASASRTSSSLKGLIIASIFSWGSCLNRVTGCLPYHNLRYSAELLFKVVGVELMARQQLIEFGAVAPRHPRGVSDVALVICSSLRR